MAETHPYEPDVRIPDGANDEGDGIVVGHGPIVVDAYIDFLCPFCRQFEERSGPTLERLVEEEAISLVYHPLGFLDGLSTTRYSSRAASASGCASDAGQFLPYLHELYDNQPPEGGPGLSDQELVMLGGAAGIDDPRFAGCVTAHAHLPWVAYVSERALARGVSGTPSTFVEGVPVPANAQTILAAIAAVTTLRSAQ
jgi:protein-disulfide isomerase